tara:strand:+ start:282 stop:1049 length:768 start_codon:yes stop_codon:yes gene_type:complete
MKKNYFSLKKFNHKVNIGFFTSRGGVSKGNYKSLNCSLSSKDKVKNVKKNISIAIKKLGIENKKLKLINQTHSNKIFLIDSKNYMDEFYGDGLITKEKNIALAILTADCVPIFVFDIENSIVCCLHSGWKGSLLNIVAKSVKRLKLNKIKPFNTVAIVGPCLEFSKFEVDKNFKNKFVKKNNSYLKFFKYKNKVKDTFNLRGLINFQLKNEGIKKIYNINVGTYKNSEYFFSHRRSTHQNEINTGRMINIISLKD